MLSLRRVADLLRHRGQAVQYELERQTPAGDWQNFYADPHYNFVDSFPTPHEQPTFGEHDTYPPGRYRCVKRVAGEIETVLWTVDSPEAEAYYEARRE